MTPKLSKNQISELTKTYKMKIVQLHEQTPKQFLNFSSTPKIARQGPKKSKMTPKLSQNKMSELKVTQKMKVAQLHEQTPKQLSNPTLTQKQPIREPQPQKQPYINESDAIMHTCSIECMVMIKLDTEFLGVCSSMQYYRVL